MPVEVSEPVVLADVGKTSIRAELRAPDEAPRRVVAAAGGVLGDSGGTNRLLVSLADVLVKLPASTAEARVACVGIAGWLANAELHHEVALRVAAMLPSARVELTSDLVLAHVGALHGAPGTVMIAGTGAVALGIGDGGEMRMADGFGPVLGDEGGGAWIGREGLAAALRAAQGRGPDSTLQGAAAAHFEVDVEHIPGLLLRREHAVRELAGFAPVVLREWGAGCAVAASIAADAAARLARTATAAATVTGETAPLALNGSLMLDLRFRALVIERIVTRLPRVAVRDPVGDALDGAALLAATSADSGRLERFRLSAPAS